MTDSEYESRDDGQFIKIIDVIEDGHVFFGGLTNGGNARFSMPEPVPLSRGDIIFITEGRWYPAPDTAWPDDSSVGVVRKPLDDGVALEGGAGIRVLKGKPSVEGA